MEGSRSEIDRGVRVSLELSGEYEDVIDKLDTEGDGGRNLGVVLNDLSLLLDTVVKLDGGTRSAIAEQLPDEMSIPHDSQAVVDALQVLERYELVRLEGNTWKPGDRLQR